MTSIESAANQILYEERRKRFIEMDPSLAGRLPEMWPGWTAPDRLGGPSAGRINNDQVSEVLALGFSWCWIDLPFIQRNGSDGVRVHRVHTSVLVYPEEIVAFARALGMNGFHLDAFNDPDIAFCFPETAQDVVQVLHRLYGTAGQAASLGGIRIIDRHDAEIGDRRREWLPLIYATLGSRISSLGNAPHDAWLGAKHVLMHSSTLYARPRLDMLKGLYKGQSAICIASGPSLSKHLEYIKQIQREHIIIATDSIYKGLIAQGIFPDFVTVVERTDDMHRLFDGTDWQSETTWCVALPLVHPSTVETFRHRVIWWWNKDAIYPWIDPQVETNYSGRSAGTLTIALAGWMGVDTAYLVGHDLSYAPDGTTHSPTVAEFTKTETVSYEKGVTDQNAGDKVAPAFRHQQQRIPGNGDNVEVLTNGTWLMFKSDIEAIIPSFPETRFVNTNLVHGALINGTWRGALPRYLDMPIERIGRKQQVSGMRWSVYWKKVRNLISDMTHFSKESAATLVWLQSVPIDAIDALVMAQVAQRTTIAALLGPERSNELTDNTHFFNFIFCPSYNCYLLECHKQAKESELVIERRYKVIRESVKLMEVFASLSAKYAGELTGLVEDCFNRPAAIMKAMKEKT